MSSRISGVWRSIATPLLLATLAAPAAQAQANVTTPKAFLGHNIGDDYFLPTYDQFMAYWKKIDGESNRMQVMEIGKTGEGRPHFAAIITAPENFAKLARYKEISQRLHAAQGLTDEQARALAKEGKSVVWIDGGLHATEVVGANQLMETSYQLVSRTDEETMRILKDVITVMVHANPDGMQMVAKCYMQNPVPEQRRGPCSTRLYEKYAGHDNNRDFYMSNLPESQNMNKLMYWEWLPQIMYNHHQTGPAGTVIFSPPFRDPFNYNFDPMIVMGLDMVGAAMHQRFLQENKPGFTMRSGSSYSTWWNGGLRTTAYFQNIIGILTEIIGSPTPSSIPIVLGQMLPRGDLPAPIAPQEWHFRQSIDYSVTANYSILDLASRYKDQFLFNIYRMGANQIARGSTDHWTISNEDMARADTAMRLGATGAAGGGRGGRGGAAGAPAGGDSPDAGFGGRGGPTMSVAQYNAVFKDPARRDPRAYVIPVTQPDFATATKFVNTLRYIGIDVQRATAPFTTNGKSYGAGSYVIHSAQSGRAHIIDQFEPQDHPNDMDERGIPKRPYDNAGWTLAYQMGVQFDRFMDDVKGPFESIRGLADPLAGTVAGASGATGYLISGSVNDAFTVANRAIKANGDVFRLARPMTANGKTFGAGSFYVTASATTTPALMSAAKDLGVSMEGTSARPDASSTKLTAKRIALWDTQTGSMSSGWTRYLLERFEFPFKVVCGAGFDDTDLKAKYDVIVLPSDGNIGGGGGGRGGGGGGGGGGGDAAATPSTDPDLRSLCDVNTGTGTGATALANIRKFVEAGGIVVAAGNSARIGQQLGLPISDYLVDKKPGESDVHLGSDKFYVPGSVLRIATDSTASSALGMQGHTDMFFNNSPVFRLAPDAAARGVRPVAWFDTATPLRSGWAWGQNYLQGGVTAVEASLGRGSLFLFGPEITFRGQPHGTFKMLFNSIYNVPQKPVITP
ncbi:MAG: peptidase [Gemmatimonadaceae bacterium]|nr:peptidase [Gemmatimonadaceae bacterium]